MKVILNCVTQIFYKPNNLRAYIKKNYVGRKHFSHSYTMCKTSKNNNQCAALLLPKVNNQIKYKIQLLHQSKENSLENLHVQILHIIVM